MSNAEPAPLIAGLRSAPLMDWPFAFKMVRQTLAADLFAEARKSFPQPGELRPKVEGRAHARYSDRRMTIQLADYPDIVAVEHRAAWREIADFFLTSSALVEALRACFAPVFEREMRARFGSRPISYSLVSELVYDRSGFALLPHTDGANKAATMLTYFADENDPSTLGTMLFAPKDPDFTDPPGEKFWPMDTFGSATQAPYLPNATVAFARSRRSFHGVSPTSGETPRRLIQTSLMATPQ